MRVIICALDENSPSFSFSLSAGVGEAGDEEEEEADEEEDATSFRTSVFAKRDEFSWIRRRT
jgi:hypothetical protein